MASFGTQLFCFLLIGVGGWLVVDNGVTTYTGVQLAGSDETTDARIINKHVEKPGAGVRPRVDGISINGTKARHPRTYFYGYFLTVSYAGENVVREALAPVSYDRWHAQKVGDTVPVTVLPGAVTHVDAEANATMIYGLKHIAVGLAMAALGLVVMRMPDSD